jgi:hypothetical protein
MLRVCIGSGIGLLKPTEDYAVYNPLNLKELTLDDLSEVGLVYWEDLNWFSSPKTLEGQCLLNLINIITTNSKVWVEYPECFIHTQYFLRLAAIMREGKEVVILTHNSDLMDHFTQQVDCVEVYNEEGNKEDFKVPLSRILDSFLKEGWELGDIHRVGEPALDSWSF